MSWENVKSALRKLPPEAFEGFVAELLGALLNQPFIIARKGDQPGGDARSFDGSVRLQAKHYIAAKIPDADIIADFHRVRLNYPSMETYVVGTVFPINDQLRSTLDGLEIEFGIEIATLDYALQSSPLSILTLSYWNAARRFSPLASIDSATHAWALSQGQNQGVQARLKNLQIAFSQSTRLFTELRNASNRRLAGRFGKAAVSQADRFAIDLPKAITRKSIQNKFKQWKTSNGGPVLVLEGEEGMGKSWAAASCADEIAKEDGCAALWMDSHEWAGASDIRQLIATALARISIPGIKDLAHWQRKAEFTWPDRLYLFLDGANENDALPTAQRLVSEARSGTRILPRLVFTTRPLDRLHAFNKAVWNKVTRCEVGPFDDDEFALALTALSCPLQRHDIPPHLDRWARIPRMLNTCVRLRDQFGGFGNVTREMILWADLLDKITQTDPQVRKVLKWRDDEEAAQVLARLAEELLRTGSRNIGRDQVSACFSGDYEKVLVALEELRLADKARQMRTTVSADCNLLGLALLICERLRLPLAVSIRAEADEFRRFLEPLAEVDERTQALFLTLQLTAQSSRLCGPNITQKRAALLLAWGASHNTKVTPDKLQFWAGCDPLAYAAFLETLFEETLSDSAVMLVLRPLAECWRDDVRLEQTLQPILEKWLLLTWPDSEAATSVEVEREGHRLPVAHTQQQLGLTLVAIAVISFKPTTGILPALALSRATLDYSICTRMFPKTPSLTSEREPHVMSLKSKEHNFGALIRFGFTEAVLPDLQRLAVVHAADAATLRGLQLLTASLCLAEVPAELQLPSVAAGYRWKGVPAVKLLKERRRLYPTNRDEYHVEERNIAHLAIRDDLPEMLSEDQALLVRQAELALESHDLASRSRSMTDADDTWDRSGVWLARFAPDRFLTLTSEYREKVFAWPEPLRAFALVEDYLHQPSVFPSAKLLMCAKRFWQKEPKPPDRQRVFLAARLHILGFLNFTPSELLEWLEFAVNDDQLRRGISHHPSNAWLRAVTPKEVADLARKKVFECADEPAMDDTCAAGHFDFWARLATASAEPDAEMFNQIRVQSRQRNPTRDRRYHWLSLLFAFATDSCLERGLQDGDLRECFDRDGCNALWFVGQQLQPQWLRNIPLESLLEWLPVDEVGKVAAANGDDAVFRQWGLELLGRANELVGNPPFDRRYWGDFVLEFDRAGYVECQFAIVGIPKPTAESPQIFAPPAPRDFRDFMGDNTDEQNEALALANSDYAEVDASSVAACFGFGGLAALSQWRRQHPIEFLRLAKPILSKAIEHPDRSFHLASLIHALLCNLLALEPDEADRFYGLLMTGGMRVQCNTEHRVPQFCAALWNPHECNLPRHTELRRRMVEEAGNEREIMTLMIAAMANGGNAEAERLALEWIAAPVAKQRAIGVSALAWLCGDSQLKKLRELEASDPVNWLRRHAGWAAEVNLQNAAGARFYRRLLTEPDAAIASTMLTQFEPALTPAASYWRREVEYEVLAKKQLDRRVKAILTSFWMSWQYRTATPEIAGRKLDEWSFGECLRHIDEPKPMPFLAKKD